MRLRETFIIPDWTDLWPASASQNDWRTKKRRRERISRPKQTALWIQGAKEMADDEAADSRIFAKSGQMAGYVISGIFAYAGPGFIGISGHIMDGVVSGNDHERSQVDSAYFLFRQPAKDMIQRGISLYRPT